MTTKSTILFANNATGTKKWCVLLAQGPVVEQTWFKAINLIIKSYPYAT